MLPLFFRKKVPHKSGVYIFKDSTGKVLYVGKAIDLYSRVSQYFSSSVRDKKTVNLVSEIKSLDTIIVESELEALILEANLIKKYLPPFNIRLTDDRDYLYIIVTKEAFPKIITGRKKDLGSSLKNFGPFPSAKTVRNTLKQLRKIFSWCSSNPPKIGLQTRFAASKSKICFYYHLGLCPGACVGEITQKDYKKIINRFIKFMEGKKEQLIGELIKEMSGLSKAQKFEEAGIVKKIIQGIAYLTAPNRTKMYLENPNFLEEENKQALVVLQKDLNLPRLPEKIEGYDISNLQGKEATGSMVVLTNGEIDKSQYRKFKIHPPAGGPGKPNDVGMHSEMMRRRLRNDWPLPDLMIIDGGIAQARAAKYEILNTKYDIPVFGLAKRMEWLYKPDGTVVRLPRHSPSLKLLQKLRDEAHRFAITYHKKLRKKDFLGL